MLLHKVSELYALTVLKAQNGFHWAKIKVMVVFLLEPIGKYLFPLFSSFQAAYIPWLVASSQQLHHSGLCSHNPISFSNSDSPASLSLL